MTGYLKHLKDQPGSGKANNFQAMQIRGRLSIPQLQVWDIAMWCRFQGKKIQSCAAGFCWNSHENEYINHFGDVVHRPILCPRLLWWIYDTFKGNP